MTTCMNCGIAEGPFEREVIPTPALKMVLIGCARGKLLTRDVVDEKTKKVKVEVIGYEGTMACSAHRRLRDAKQYGVQVTK